MFKVLVCVGRDFGNLSGSWWSSPSLSSRKKQYEFVHRTLDRLTRENNWPMEPTYLMPQWKLISGGGRGVDAAAYDYAVINWMSVKEYLADWDKYGKSAGDIRNKQMLDIEHPDVVVAFPGGKGTAKMVKLAKSAGVPVIEIEYKEEVENKEIDIQE